MTWRHLLIHQPLLAGLLVACLAPIGPGSACAATCYTNDGVLSGRLEALRWFINRARYAPERDADRMALTNTTAGGHPDYDVCEDTDGTNDFGTTTNTWALWKASKPPLAPNAAMTRASQKHSQDMATTGLFQHESPSGTYYASNTPPQDRLTAEGYVWSACGENITAGSPISYYTPDEAHKTLFIDTDIVDRGHRKNILDYYYNFREIGLGYATGGGWGYYTEDFGRSGTNHFLTDTIFCDTNSNRVYDDGEGVSNVEVRLWYGGTQASWYDVSTQSGNFAVPIADLPDSAEIMVQLVNKSGSNRWLTIPMGFTNQGALFVTNNEAVFVSRYTQPAGITNVGFRNTSPIVRMTTVTFADTNTVLSFGPFKGVNYEIQSREELTVSNWVTFVTALGSNTVSQVMDTGQGGRGAPSTKDHRFYRAAIQKD